MRLFRTLDETFPNIEEIELHTKQDIPNYQQIDVTGTEYADGYIGLFCKYYIINDNEPLFYPSLWLKKFSAPNVKRVGNVNFYRCENLTEINIPAAEIIGMGAFDYCKKLALINISSAKIIEYAAFFMCNAITHINCFRVEEIEWWAFAGCTNLVAVNFNTDISEQITINFGYAVFGGAITDFEPLAQIILTPNIELTIGNVLPAPDTVFNTWHRTYEYGNDVDYVWKKITYTSIKEEIEEGKYVYCIGNNRYILDNIVEKVEMFDLMGKQIMVFENQEIIDLNNICSGVYFLKCYSIYNRIKIEKIIVY